MPRHVALRKVSDAAGLFKIASAATYSTTIIQMKPSAPPLLRTAPTMLRMKMTSQTRVVILSRTTAVLGLSLFRAYKMISTISKMMVTPQIAM